MSLLLPFGVINQNESIAGWEYLGTTWAMFPLLFASVLWLYGMLIEQRRDYAKYGIWTLIVVYGYVFIEFGMRATGFHLGNSLVGWYIGLIVLIASAWLQAKET
jgi:hypothetical protein